MFYFSSERCFIIVVYKRCYRIDPSVINGLAFGYLGSLSGGTINKRPRSYAIGHKYTRPFFAAVEKKRYCYNIGNVLDMWLML